MRARDRAAKQKKAHGVTPEFYSKMIATQHGRCAICGRDLSTLPPKKVHIDHDHKTGIVRGILCHWCNLGIGKFKDDPSALRRAFAYIRGSAVIG
jgi:hypothetical protein